MTSLLSNPCLATLRFKKGNDMKALLLITILCVFSSPSFAAMHKEELSYSHGETTLRGYFFWDDAFEGKRPSIVVFHERWGLNDCPLLRAEMLAEAGYLAFAADLYGEAQQTRRPAEAEDWLQQVTSNAELWQQRNQLALEQLLKHPHADNTRVAALGFSFGADSAIHLAYSGAKINGVISMHGSLPAASSEQARNIKARVLVLHGASDPFIGKTQIDRFTESLNHNDVDWEMVSYGGARHGFSNPYADGYGRDGQAYHDLAEQRAWGRALTFLEDIFADDF